MSSHGKVLDLLDDRYLNLQDVFGNVEPFPSLVPYEQYLKTMLVYRMDTNHEIFMALLQDFTDRFSRQHRREVWTWCIQWEVEQRSAEEPGTPAAKKLRMDGQAGAVQDSQPAKPKLPVYTRMERRCLHPDLFQEEDMLRILIDIVQVDSKFVPNYIEFLYQWIDYYEGGGKALKAALRMEIPSLWLFEYHPLPLFNNDSKGEDKDGLDKAAEKIGEKFTRNKPDLSEMERLTEQSERLQYREVKFGLQRPIDPKDEPLPPLINVPHDYYKRNRYYAACFKNRQRAFWLLQEAGVSARQIANYKKLQPMSAMETPEDFDGDGFLNYYKEEPSANIQYEENRRNAQLREKQREIAVSNRLAEEARIAAHNGSAEQRHVPPVLIPSALRNGGRPNFAAEFMARLRSMERNRDPPIRAVSLPLLGKMKSKAFANVVAKPPPIKRQVEESNDEDMDDDEDDDDDDYESDPDDANDDDENVMDVTPSAPVQLPPNAPTVPPTTQPGLSAAASLAAYMLSLNLDQLRNVMPLLNAQAQEAVRRQHPLLNGQWRAPVLAVPRGGPQPTTLAPSGGPSTGAPPPNLPIPPASSAAIPSPNQQAQQQTMMQTQPQVQLPAPGQLPTQSAGSSNAMPTPAMGPSIGSQHNVPAITVNPPRPTARMQGQPSQATSASGARISGSVPPGANLPAPVAPTQVRFAGSSTIHSAASGPQGQGPVSVAGVNPAGDRTPPLIQYPAPWTIPPAHQNRMSFAQRQHILSSLRAPPPSHLTLAPPQASVPISVAGVYAKSPSPMTPLAGLANVLSLSSPAAASPYGVPIEIYVPQVVLAHNADLPDATDCLILGYTHPGTGILTLSKAVFLPADIWENTLNRVRRGHFHTLESYAPPPNHPRFVASKGLLRNPEDVQGPHKFVYDKLAQMFQLMTGCMDREEEVTKRWRTTQGPMRARDRGSVWEGWGLYVDHVFEMGYEERRGVGAIVRDTLDGKLGVNEEEEREKARRRKELEELEREEELEEMEEGDEDDDVMEE